MGKDVSNLTKNGHKYVCLKHPKRNFFIFPYKKESIDRLKKKGFKQISVLPDGWSYFESKMGFYAKEIR